MAAVGPAAAQTDAASALERQTDDAFRQVLQQPQELALWSRYAQLLVQAGNYEGGIAALERLLLQPSPPPGVALEVGVLYYRLGSYAMAESMLRRSLNDARLQPAQRELAKTLLADVQRRNKPSYLTGVFTFGLRSQSNPMYRTPEAQVFSGGTLVAAPASQKAESDWDASLGLRLQHQYDLGFQNSAAISTTFGAYIVDYHSSSGRTLVANPTRPYDLVLLELSSGIQFKPAPDALPGLTLRPHVLGSSITAQGHGYLQSAGVGIDASYRANERTLAEVTLDAQDRRFQTRIDVPNAALVSGRMVGLRGRVVREVAPGQVLVAELGARTNRTEQNFSDYDQTDARLTYSVSYASPVGALKGRWTTAIWTGALRRAFDAADPAVNPFVVRKDTEWRVGLNQSIPVVDLWSVQLALEHARGGSNLPNFRYRNTSVSGAIVRSF